MEQTYLAATLSSEKSNKHLLWVSKKSSPSVSGCNTCKVKDKLSCVPAFPLTSSRTRSLIIPSPSTIRWSLVSRHKLQVHQSCSADMHSGQLCRNFACICCVITFSSQRFLPSLLEKLTQRHCQVCLILSCLTCCYLEHQLPEPLNPFVTHNKEKLGRCFFKEDREL